MKYLILVIVLFVSCSKSKSAEENKKNVETEKHRDSFENYNEIQLQHFAYDEFQVGFDIMPVADDGTPLGCDSTGINFTIKKYFNNQLQEDSGDISVECQENKPSKVGIVLDNSGSIRSHRLIIESGVDALLDEVAKSGSTFSLTEVHTNSQIITPLTDSKTLFKENMKKMINKDGWTALYDGIRLGHESLEDKVSWEGESDPACNVERKAIIVMTDGYENNSREQKYEEYSLEEFPGDKIDTTLDDLKLLRSNERKIPIFTIGVGGDVDANGLSDLSNETGGSYRALSDFKEMPEAFQEIGDYLRSPYHVCVESKEMACGEYKVEISYSSENGPTGDKVISFSIPCEEEEEDEQENTEVVIDPIDDEEDIESEEGKNELELSYEKKIIFPLFNDENGKKELQGINLYFESSKNLNITTSGSINLARESSFSIKDVSKEIVDLEKNYVSASFVESSFTDSKTLKGVYKIPSSSFSSFLGEGTGELIFKAYDFLEWDTNEKIQGTLGIKGNFIVEYIWRYRDIQGVIIPDPNLRLAVRNATGIRVGNITPEAMEKLTSIDVRNKEITTFQGIEYAPNLTHLYIGNTKTRDISFLKHLANLKLLDLNSNNIDDFSFLSSLGKIQTLYLNSTNLSNLSHIHKLSTLITLQMSSTEVSDVFLLKDLTNLESFKFRNCEISNYSYFSLIPRLKSLDLYNCINDPAPSFKLRTDITYNNVQIGRTRLTSLKSLAGIDIKTLSISQNSLENLSEIVNIPSLISLTASNNGFNRSDFLYVLKLPALQTLNFNANLIYDIQPEVTHSTLRTLYVQSAGITDISGIVLYPNLYRVNVSYNNLESLTPLSGISGLSVIYALSTTGTGLDSLEALENLSYLDITNTDISSFNDINFSTFPKLASFIMRNVNMNNISILDKENYSYFDLRYNNISCDDQKKIVDAQYEGKTILYTSVPGCPHVYQPGVTESFYEIADSKGLGMQFFGDFDTSNSVDEMSGSYNTTFEPIELNSNESIENLNVILVADINREVQSTDVSNFSLTLNEKLSVEIKADDKIIYSDDIDRVDVLNYQGEGQKVTFTNNLNVNIELDQSQILEFINADKVFINIGYISTPEFSADEVEAFNINNEIIGEAKINYNVKQVR